MLTITPLYAGLLGLWYLVLSFRVIGFRHSGKVSLGDGGQPGLTRAIRSHANFAEYVPLVLVLIGFLETGGTYAAWVLHLLGALLLTGRVLHGIALSFTEQWMPGRALGIMLTFASLLIASVLCVLRSVAALTVTGT